MNNTTLGIFSALGGFWQSTPDGVTALLVLLIGLVMAVVLRLVVARVLEQVGFNKLCERIGFSEFLRKGVVSYTPARLVGLTVYWVILLATLVLTLHLMRVEFITTLSQRITEALPGVISAVCIAVLGCALVSFLANVVHTITRNAAFPHGDLISKAIRWLGIFLVLGIAIEQLGIEIRLISATFQIVMGAVVFGLALAFGLGCKDIARDAMQRFLESLRERNKSTRGDFEG